MGAYVKTLLFAMTLLLTPAISGNASTPVQVIAASSERTTFLPEVSKAYQVYQYFENNSEHSKVLWAMFIKENGRSFEDSSGLSQAKLLADWAVKYPSENEETLIELRRRDTARPQHGSVQVRALALKYFPTS